MKNVILHNAHTHFACPKTSRSGNRNRLMPIVAVCAGLLSFLLAGCHIAGTKPQNVPDNVITRSTVDLSGRNESGTALPYGVSLQTDDISALIPCEMERVVDGDTIIVNDPDGNRLRVRLTGIDAPESVAEDESLNTEEGLQASRFLKDYLSGTGTVYLEYDVEQFDRYGRTLAYVWTRNGSTYIMVNEVVLAAGHAVPVSIKPNLKYADTFNTYGK